MKDLNDGLLLQISVGSLVRIVLKENLVVEYDNNEKRAFVKASRFPSNMRSAQTGKFKNYEASTGTLEIETLNGYPLRINEEQVESYNIQD